MFSGLHNRAKASAKKHDQAGRAARPERKKKKKTTAAEGPTQSTPPPENDGEQKPKQPESPEQQIAKIKGRKRKNTFVFTLGGIFGLLLALFFANQNQVINLDGVMDKDLLTSLTDALPAGMLNDFNQFTGLDREKNSYDSFSVGLHLRSQGVHAKHPVIMIPGVISTGLESWGTGELSRPYFRRRLWGSWSMMRALVLDKAFWKAHIMLNKETGLDPPNIKLRAATGFDATDFFITGYWIWNKVLENLATIGYDPTNSFSAPYDWRLSYINLEKRDHYFTYLKGHIETLVRISNKKAVFTSHSMGSQVAMFFFKWVEHPDHGKGGSDWVDRHIDSWINISGCMLGAAKGLSAVLSGEMKDTAQLNSFALYGLEKFLSRDERTEIFRAMPGISSMLPKGGNAIWGNGTFAPDDDASHTFKTLGNIINFDQRSSRRSATLEGMGGHFNLTAEESYKYLLDHVEAWYRKQLLQSYSHGVAHTAAEVEANGNDPRKWLNPLETRLPRAPHMKIYCFYGVGKPTERAYFYRDDDNSSSATSDKERVGDPTQGPKRPSPRRDGKGMTIDTSITNANGSIDHGIVMSEGDGTVNLMSLGYMCAKGWHMKRYNPSGVKVTVFEMPHEPDRFSPRGGPNTGDHVDILGRSSLNDLLLRIAGGLGHLIEENFTSPIKEYAERVPIYEETRS